MRILSVHIDGFGKFRDRDFAFGPQVNVIQGCNEAGKSTLHSFLEAMLLGPNKKARSFAGSVYEAMEPWDPEAPYRGSMRVEQNGTVYRIERNFEKGGESLAVWDEAAGSYAAEPEALLRELLSGMTPEACRNTISVGQLSARTGAALRKELIGYVDNMGSTAHPELNAERAVSYLQKKKERLSGQLAADCAKEYASSLGRIKNIEAELNKPGNDNRLLYFRDRRNRQQEELGRVREELAGIGEQLQSEEQALQESGLRSKEDVAALDQKADELYEAWKTAQKAGKNGLRIAGIVFCALLLAASGVGIWAEHGSRMGLCYIAVAAVSLILLSILIYRAVSAARNLRTAQEELLTFMESYGGVEEISEESLKQTHQLIHRMDEVLASRDRLLAEQKERNSRAAALASEEEFCSRSLEEQLRIRTDVEEKLNEENRLRREAAGLRQQIAENSRLKEQIDAIDIAIDTIEDLSAQIRGRLGTWLNDEASRTLEKLTAGHYRSMDAGSGSDISLNSREGMISVSEVSAGTMDQVYLAVRLAAARFMMQGEDTLPLIFDDSFALYDDERHAGAVKFVTTDYRGQIFIFTCHRREEEILAGTEYRLLKL